MSNLIEEELRKEWDEETLAKEDDAYKGAHKSQDWIDNKKVNVYTAGNEKKEGKEMDKTIVNKWKNRKEEELRKEWNEKTLTLAKEDDAYKDIVAAIDKWRLEIGYLAYVDVMTWAKPCTRLETKKKIAAIDKEYKNIFEALDKKAEMINAAMEFANDYDSMKKVLEDFGVWKEIIDG